MVEALWNSTFDFLWSWIVVFYIYFNYFFISSSNITLERNFQFRKKDKFGQT